MIAFYLQIKLVHIAAVLASGGLFALRGALVLAGVRWAMAAPLRYLSYTIDTVLLTAALMLLTALKLNPFVVPWLSVKLALLLVYVVLGSLALKRARTRRARAFFFVAALATFGFMYFVARAHHPLGLLQGLAS
ncbi:MAG TPA: SirB2 family protein [Arenimonas sp.]|uniref:SirB2 family protein n=1 Tax=Arenimonas sp. TaxID=1872635 RepID=UPI002D7F7C07|nr:SirB2 family protein [Arenimonas sp.]HEU0153069.1 SirB2 family protein [Arenimonas sp.]